MEWTLVVGYLAAIIGAFYVLPQTVHVIRVGSSAGLSPLTWQLQVGASTGWTVHGFLTGQPNVWACNIVVLCCAAIILIVICRDRKLSWNVWVLSVLVAGALVTVDSVFGAVAYGMLIIVPMTVSMMIQFQALWVAPTSGATRGSTTPSPASPRSCGSSTPSGTMSRQSRSGPRPPSSCRCCALACTWSSGPASSCRGLPATSPPCPPAERQMGHGLAPWGPL